MTRYLSLAEYFWLAEQVTGVKAEVLAKASRVDLADSALHAPEAGFGDDDFYPDLIDKAAVLTCRLAWNHDDAAGDRFCVDARRAFATGLSSGAFMTSYLARRLPGRIAAVVTVAGSVHYDQPECGTERVVPVLAFHGSADHNVPFDDQR